MNRKMKMVKLSQFPTAGGEKMARFSVGGDDDGNEERPSNDRPLPKRPRISNPVLYTRKRPNSVAASASNSGGRAATSTPRNPASTSAAPQPPPEQEFRPEEAVTAEEESGWESVGATDSSWSDSSSGDDSQEEGGEQEQNRSGDEVQPIEARQDSTPTGNGLRRESEGPSEPVSVTLTDPDVLDCPICFEPLCSPVYQCENGHIACASCCTTMRNKCPSCCWPIGYNRCRAIEKVLESVRVACPNKPHGCVETLSYSQKLVHEKTCKYSPCSCPYLGCGYAGMSHWVYTHFTLMHNHASKNFLFGCVFSISLDNNQKNVFLLESTQTSLFVLNRSIESFGSFINVVCVAPTSAKTTFSYDLQAIVGESSITLKTSAECMPKWTPQHRAKMYLLVPNDIVSTSGQLRLELTIRKDPAPAS